MQQRLFRFFVIAIIPWVILLAVVANLWYRDVNQASNTGALFANFSPVSFGIQAIVGLAATLVVVISQALSKTTVKPFELLLGQVNVITAGKSVSPPEETGMDEVDATISNLYLAATDAQRRLDAERTLAADVSHQLRSPLTALSLRLEQISQDTLDSKVHDDSIAALGQVDRLVKLVEGLLTTWRSTTDRDLTEINVSELLANVSDRWQNRVRSSGREIVIQCAPELAALGTQEVQELVISVLIENSLQHGAGTIHISAKDFQSWTLIEIKDEGQGISQDIESTLMMQGVTTGGTGLGLAWARNQVASDGGRLELRSLKPAVFGIFLMSVRSGVEISR
ncbi:MAG: sensor histidine kinase [Actinobacteria bacterium]|jgi:signal transduction histidine kinase|nr:sensor histidine kinase [Actinomycetota bacterium]NBO34918.1 sensor histidine kinase [Actinomycetota bacterium]